MRDAAYPDRLIEWLFACLMLSWGAWLCLPMDTFANPQYAALRVLAPAEVWGALSISIATLRMTALWVNGSWRRTPVIRCGCSVLGVVWWLSLVFLAVAASAPHPPAGLTWYPVIAAFELASCWRSAADGFHSRAFKLGRTSKA